MVILEAGLSRGVQPSTSMSFERTAFENAALRAVQDAARALQSNAGGVKDISVALGDGSNSGPVMRDLLVPTFNHGCSMMRIIATMLPEQANFTVQDLFV
eukprot:gene17785-24160_t